jgi:hypothetical protein
MSVMSTSGKSAHNNESRCGHGKVNHDLNHKHIGIPPDF